MTQQRPEDVPFRDQGSSQMSQGPSQVSQGLSQISQSTSQMDQGLSQVCKRILNPLKEHFFVTRTLRNPTSGIHLFNVRIRIRFPICEQRQDYIYF